MTNTWRSAAETLYHNWLLYVSAEKIINMNIRHQTEISTQSLAEKLLARYVGIDVEEIPPEEDHRKK